MHLEELIIEGFKSYATRTVVGPFDNQFNAITGLNGSGKSNILDALCFVLGLDNLRQVRAGNLADLVYKRGQAGITKCSVTAVFNNEDSAKSPIGYQDSPKVTVTRQIILGGNKQKFLINGHNVPQKAVDSLFQSVQLNVNNPHFLIMQGQITKVINMRPLDLLSLLEESAGTRMFEERRRKALTTMERKDGKVQEISTRLHDIVEPRLQSLRSQRSEFVEFKRSEADLERLKRLVLAYDFCEQLKLCDVVKEEIGVAEQDMRTTQVNVQTWRGQLRELDGEIDAAERRINRDRHQEEQMHQAEHELSLLEKELARLQQKSSLDSKLLDEKARQRRDLTNRKAVHPDAKQLQQERAKGKQLLAALTVVRERLQQQESLLQGMSTGVSVNGGAASYEQLLEQQERSLAASETRLSKLDQEAHTLDAQLPQLQLQCQKARKHATQSRIDALRQRIATAQQQLADLGNNTPLNNASVEGQWRSHSKRLQEARNEAAKLRSSVQHILSTDFAKGIRGVKGIVAGLIEEVPRAEHCVPLEVVAGGKLFNVVVTDEQAGKDVLTLPGLTKRITVIPLSKILPRNVPAERQRRAQELCQGKAQVALSLLVHADEVRPAMEFVFGGTFVCADKESAQCVAFDTSIATRAVTLEGDVYEPSGLLTGGSAAPSSGLLQRLFAYKRAAEQLKEVERTFATIDAEYKQWQERKQTELNLSQQIDVDGHELKALEESWSRDVLGRAIPDLTKCEQRRAEVAEERRILNEQLVGLCEEIGRLRRDLGKDKHTKLAELSKAIGVSQRELAAAESAHAVQQARLDQLEGAERDVYSQMERSKQMQAELDSEIQQLQQDLLGQAQQVAVAEQQCDSRRRDVETLREAAMRQDAHLQQLQDRRFVLADGIDKATQRLAELTRALEHKRQQLSAVIGDLAETQRKHAWLKDSQKEFGQHGTLFDWDAIDMDDVRKRLQRCEDDFARMRRSVNHNVMDMIDRMEQKENSLKAMLDTVKGDKGKIERTLVTLDDYKVDALMRTWQQVNSDFGGILGELLPGSTGRLDPVERDPNAEDGSEADGEGDGSVGGALSRGLVIKVALGGVWKTGLTELSGGQRSLVALALVLALLRHKPAPVYILDEVDAALDLSHTQNIGHLLKTQFPGAQFVVVSLKEGMFANANVLFRTHVRDGVSSVERLTSQSAAAKAPVDKKPLRRAAVEA